MRRGLSLQALSEDWTYKRYFRGLFLSILPMRFSPFPKSSSSGTDKAESPTDAVTAGIGSETYQDVDQFNFEVHVNFFKIFFS
jgi:hypothetical protein